MIVATKEIKIESGYCPDLTMHVGEVNKQYILVPPIDISGYSVRSEIVKPDHTFVYTDQAINTDGNILFTLPEQAGAVAGYGYYIIKIYDLNTVVYSAVGNLIIDDHLIMDGMIESVAEVNGYTFPDDFMTRGEIYEEVFDDTTVSNETGWSSSKINSELSGILDDTNISNDTGWTSTKIKNYVDNSALDNYSTEEKVVGSWIDGKPIYEQTIIFQNAVTLSANVFTNVYDLSTIDAETLIMLTPYTDNVAPYRPFGYFLTDITSANMLRLETPTVTWYMGGMTIRYTKTTD